MYNCTLAPYSRKSKYRSCYRIPFQYPFSFKMATKAKSTMRLKVIQKWGQWWKGEGEYPKLVSKGMSENVMPPHTKISQIFKLFQ